MKDAIPSDALANLKKLPRVAYFDNARDGTFSTDAPLVAVTRGEPGYYPIYTRHDAAWHNARAGVTAPQAAAMLAGSAFGWHIPLADADLYDAAGNLRG